MKNGFLEKFKDQLLRGLIWKGRLAKREYVMFFGSLLQISIQFLLKQGKSEFIALVSDHLSNQSSLKIQKNQKKIQEPSPNFYINHGI